MFSQGAKVHVTSTDDTSVVGSGVVFVHNVGGMVVVTMDDGSGHVMVSASNVHHWGKVGS